MGQFPVNYMQPSRKHSHQVQYHSHEIQVTLYIYMLCNSHTITKAPMACLKASSLYPSQWGIALTVTETRHDP